jgi:hypothetical protein
MFVYKYSILIFYLIFWFKQIMILMIEWRVEISHWFVIIYIKSQRFSILKLI